MTSRADCQAIQVSVSTACFFPLETEKAVALLMDAGERNIELFVNSFSELEPQFTRRVVEMTRRVSGRIISVHPFTSNLEDMLFSPYTRRRRDMTEFYKKYFALAAEANAPYVVMHGPSKMYHISMEDYTEYFYSLDQTARQMGVQVLQENVERCMSRDIRLLQYMKSQYPDAGFTLDIKQAIRCGVRWQDVVAALGKNIRHIHISDHDEGTDCRCPGTGNLNVSDFIGRLHGIQYNGFLSIEVYGFAEKPCSQLITSANYLRRYI